MATGLTFKYCAVVYISAVFAFPFVIVEYGGFCLFVVKLVALLVISKTVLCLLYDFFDIVYKQA